MPPPVSRRVSLGDLLHQGARRAGLDPQSLTRKGLFEGWYGSWAISSGEFYHAKTNFILF